MPPDRGYRRARELLAARFGDEIVIVDMWVRRLVGETKPQPLQEYADSLRSCYEALASMDALAHLDNSTNLPKLVVQIARIPPKPVAQPSIETAHREASQETNHERPGGVRGRSCHGS